MLNRGMQAIITAIDVVLLRSVQSYFTGQDIDRKLIAEQYQFTSREQLT